MAKKKRESQEINAASMADIAFLLLIFFLLITTIETSEGIARKLPPMPEKDKEIVIDVNARNVLEVRVNAADQLLVEGEYATIKELKDITKRFIMNYGKDPNMSDLPKDAIVSLKNDRGTSYDTYIQVQNELTKAYDEIRDEVSKSRYNGLKFNELKEAEQDIIKTEFPLKISEAEPENIGGKK
jgi:biopolymer transport protein ExbD